ncbi:MAG: hypothetical protein AB8B78_08270 [Polaribacter sp.]
MKNKIYILSILILFQSCYTYKEFDVKDFEKIKPKKVQIELKDSKTYKGKITKYQNDKIILTNSKKSIEIPILQIKTIKKRNSNFLKNTLIAVVSTYLVTILLDALLSSLFNNAIKGGFKDFKFPA